MWWPEARGVGKLIVVTGMIDLPNPGRGRNSNGYVQRRAR